MQYKSEERYIFNVHKEKEALDEFRQELKDSGIPFTLEGGSLTVTVVIKTSGMFDMSKKKLEGN